MRMPGMAIRIWVLMKSNMEKTRQEGNQSPDQSEVYFHVGLGKVASTYLQYNFFPKLKGIRYIQRTRYKKAREIIQQGGHDRYLVSREFDRQLETEVRKFSASFPNAYPIILLRRNDSWIASQYRRHVKNGFPFTFREFIDVEENKGYWDHKELEFFPKIQTLERYFSHPPLVLFHDDLKADPEKFFDRLAGYVGATYDIKSINLSPKHRSYNTQQLKAVHAISRNLPLQKDYDKGNPLLNSIRGFGVRMLRYVVMFVARWLPASWFREGPLVPPEELEKVRACTEQDWEKCVTYAREQEFIARS